MAYNRNSAIEVFVDIETVPLDLAADVLSRFEEQYEAPKNYKDPEKIAQHKEAAKAAFLERYHFRIDGCRPVVIGVGLVNAAGDVRVTQFHGDNPKKMGGELVDWLNNLGAPWRFIGFNSKNFDIPILALAVHQSGKQLKYKLGKWDAVDLMDYPLRGYKMKDAARAYGVIAAEENGSKILEWYAKGDWDSILTYNEIDVRSTAGLYLGLSALYNLL